MPVTLTINGTPREFNGDPDTPLLWVIREDVGLTGTKYGCGIAQCGACTVHVDGQTLRSCSAPVSAVIDRTWPRAASEAAIRAAADPGFMRGAPLPGSSGVSGGRLGSSAWR